MKAEVVLKSLVVCSIFLVSACTEPGETTGVGAATGGVLGAGLGAIVGNQTGDAGEGLVIGGLVGAGAGAAVGNSLEAQQKSIRTQDEAIERQQRMLAAQSSEVKELRNLSRDSGKSSSDYMKQNEKRWSSLNSNRNSQSSGLSLTDQLNMGKDQPGGSTSNLELSDSHAAMKPSSIIKSEPARPAPVSVSEDKISNALQETDLSTTPEVVNEGISSPVHAETADIAASEVKKGKSTECEKADGEMDKATKSTEAADKLFYLRRAIRLCPSNADFHRRLGDQYSSLGRNEDAKSAYEEALKLNPKMTEAKQGLNKISANHY